MEGKSDPVEDTVLILVDVRGYKVDERKDGDDGTTLRCSREGRHMVVVLLNIPLNVPRLHDYVSNLHHTILVAPSATSSAKRKVAAFSNMEFFSNEDMHFCIMAHKDASKHEKVKSAPAAKDKLPELQPDDAMVKFNGWQRGDIIRITRRSESPGLYYYYRVVV